MITNVYQHVVQMHQWIVYRVARQLPT